MSLYPAPPSAPRLPYDMDGTVVVSYSDDGTTYPFRTVAAADAQKINNTNASQYLAQEYNGLGWVAFVFPTPMTITDYFMYIPQNHGGSSVPMQASTDTTTGQDGTWTNVESGAFVYEKVTLSPNYRTSVHHLATAATGVKAVRFGGSRDSGWGNGPMQNPNAMFLYGYPTSATADILRFWDPTNDAAIDGAAFDWGDVGRGSTGTRSFRVKNTSSSLTAQGVVVSRQTLNDTTPSHLLDYQFSLDGTTWSSTVTLGDLAPGAVSSVVQVKRATSESAALGLWEGRFTAVPTSWA